MIKYNKTDNGFLIDSKYLFDFETPNPKYINLASQSGEVMKYQNPDYSLIDYAGEYDINGVSIVSIVGKDEKLNYVINDGKTKFGLIQSADILETSDIGDMEYRLYTSESVEKKLDQMELEGIKLKLTAEVVEAIVEETTENNQSEDIEDSNSENMQSEDVESTETQNT